MILWNEKELEYLNGYIHEMQRASMNTEFESLFNNDAKGKMAHVLLNWDLVNTDKEVNKDLFDLLDFMYAHYIIRGYTLDELRDLEDMNSDDVCVYTKLYKT